MACKNGSCSRRNQLGGAGAPAINNPALSNNGAGAMAQYGSSAPKSSFWTGTKDQMLQTGLLSPQQQGLQNLLINSSQGQLQNINDPNSRYSGFEPIEQKARTQFFGNTIPTLAERFTSMGDSAQNSSAFQNSLGSAGADLEEGLGALRAQYGQQEQSNQLGLLSLLLNGGLAKGFENSYVPSRPGFLENTFSSLLPIGGKLLGKYLFK